MFELTVIRCPRKELIKLSCHYIFTSLSHHIIIRLTHVNVWESVGKPCSGMQFIKSIPSSCVRVHIRYYKSHVLHLNMQWKRRFIWWNQLLLALLLVLCTHNNTDRNKFMIFSGIALYYGDTYIIFDFLSIQWLLSWLLHKWREGYLLPTWAQKISCHVRVYLLFFPNVFFVGNTIITSKQVQPPSFSSISHYKLGNLPLTACTWTWSWATKIN